MLGHCEKWSDKDWLEVDEMHICYHVIYLYIVLGIPDPLMDLR